MIATLERNGLICRRAGAPEASKSSCPQTTCRS
ncbi:hypothetical protein [Bradyrhizobium manausense]